MKVLEIKVGQVLGAYFPYSPDPNKRYGFRVERKFGNGRWGVRDVKTKEYMWFKQPDADLDMKNWYIVEDVPTK